MTKIRTRFAPSPTGRMHVGNLRTALYAYLITKHEGGDFILRIEDTDQERYVEGAVDIIYRTLEKTGLLHDEGPDKDGGFGPYVQSERQATGMYLKYAKQLIEQGDAYYCFCGKEELESMKRTVAGKEISIYDKRCLHLSKEEVQRRLDAGEPHVIRFNMPTEGTTTFHDVIYGDINAEQLEAIKHHCINPVDSRETDMVKPETLVTEFAEPADVAIFDGFKDMAEADLKKLYDSLGLAMTFKDFLHIQNYFKNEEKRNPSVTEIRVLDTYWSDHCRHTTFSTELKDVTFEDNYYTEPIGLLIRIIWLSEKRSLQAERTSMSA